MRRRIVTVPAGLARAGLLGCIVLGGMAGCGGDRGGGEVALRRSTAGDTVVLTSVGAPDTVRLDGVRVLWRSDSLDRPRAMALAGNRLVVADPTRIHILTLGETGVASVASVGREGEGPGEYTRIVAVGALGADTIAVYDGANARLTRLSMGGTLLDSRRVDLRPPYDHVLTGRILAAPHGTLRWRVQDLGSVRLHRRQRVALARWDPDTDADSLLLEVPGPEVALLAPGYVVRAAVVGPNPAIAMTPGGLVASGAGLDYCVAVRDLSRGAPPRRICRERPRVPVGEGIRHPDLRLLGDAAVRARQLVRRFVDGQKVPDLLPSYDALLLGGSRLWVRTLGPAMANLNPWVLQLRPDLAPSHRDWDAFDVRSGRLLHTFSIPSSFEPKLATRSDLYGFYTLPSGEITIASLPLPPSKSKSKSNSKSN